MEEFIFDLHLVVNGWDTKDQTPIQREFDLLVRASSKEDLEKKMLDVPGKYQIRQRHVCRLNEVPAELQRQSRQMHFDFRIVVRDTTTASA